MSFSFPKHQQRQMVVGARAVEKKVKVGPAAAPTLSLMDLLQFFTGLTHAVSALHSF